MADAYADSSFLVSLYHEDPNHAAACDLMAKKSFILAYCPLHRVEIRNTLRMAEKNKLLPTQARRSLFKQIDEDLTDGFLEHFNLTWNDLFRRGDELSEAHMNLHSVRTMDLLHVAAALQSGTAIFLSFDKRQRGLAEAAGLQVGPPMNR